MYELGEHVRETEHPVEIEDGFYRVSLPLGINPRGDQADRYFARAWGKLRSRFEEVDLMERISERGAVVSYLVAVAFPYDTEENISEVKSIPAAKQAEPVKAEVPKVVTPVRVAATETPDPAKPVQKPSPPKGIESLNLRTVTRTALRKNNVSTVEQIAAMNATRILNFKRVGRGRLAEIVDALKPYGIEIRGAAAVLGVY